MLFHSAFDLPNHFLFSSTIAKTAYVTKTVSPVYLLFPIGGPVATCGCWAPAVGPVQTEMAVRVNITVDFQDLVQIKGI